MFFQLSLTPPAVGVSLTYLSHRSAGTRDHSVRQGLSEGDLGVLDEVEAVSSLDDGVNPRVELGEEARVLLELLGGLVVGVEVVGGGVEEVGTETVVGVEEDLVGVGVELGGDVLNEEGNLVDGVGVALLALEAGGLLGLLVV